MDRSTALRQAHLVRKLLEEMGSGEVEFVYRKKCGSIRRAKGTLCNDLMPDFDAKECSSQRVRNNPLLVSYWDLDFAAWRTFKAELLMEIK